MSFVILALWKLWSVFCDLNTLKILVSGLWYEYFENCGMCFVIWALWKLWSVFCDLNTLKILVSGLCYEFFENSGMCFVIWILWKFWSLVCDMIYLTAIGLPPVGSSKVPIYTQTIHRTKQSTQTIHRTTQFNMNTSKILFSLLWYECFENSGLCFVLWILWKLCYAFFDMNTLKIMVGVLW